MSFTNRVLAVDDNPTNLSILKELLQGRFDLRLASEGEEAIRIAKEFVPDVVLLDAMMPKPDGFAVCSRLRCDHALRNSRILMVSALTGIDSRLRGFEAGADDFVTKPFDERELLAKVEAAMRARKGFSKIEYDLDEMFCATGHTLELMTRLRGAETDEHLDRIRDLSSLIATALRDGPLSEWIDDQFLDDLSLASVLHDIGKIAIADAILRKPGPLNATEFKEMKLHTVVGELMLSQFTQRSDATYFPMAAKIARGHHERYDGRGYPDGLAGEDISLAARIVKLADVFDTFLTEKVHKSSYEPAQAEQIVVAGRGTMFDPIVADAMLGVLDRALEHYTPQAVLS